MVINNLSESPVTEKRASSASSALDYVVTMVVLLVLGFLAANVYVITMARNYNDTCCLTAVRSAAKAAMTGKNARAVMDAAKDGLLSCDSRFCPLDRPQFTGFKDERGDGERLLVVETCAVTNVPAPILVASGELSPQGSLVLRRTYVIKFKDSRP